MEKVGLVGFAGSGKSTAFRWLTGVAPDPSKVQQGQTGMTRVPDARLDAVSAVFKPKKTTFAEIAFLDTPGLMAAAEREDNPRRLGILREANGLLVVLDGFSGAPLADQLRRFRDELAFADLEIITKRLERIEVLLKKSRPAKERDADLLEQSILQRVVQAFESGRSALSVGLKPDEEKLIRSFQLLTLKPELVLVARGDDGAKGPLPADLLDLAPNAVQAAPKLELELEELSPEDRAAFMQDLGFTESARPAVIRTVFAAMGRIAFLTVGEDECRTWSIPEGIEAVEAAGAIHTDLSKRFVRAEVVGYDDFRGVGYSMKEAKAKGVFRLEGKTYVVKDGDIMHILASS